MNKQQLKQLEADLWRSADTLRANSDLKSSTLPATLWFFDKAKTDARILFINARNIFMQIDRAHRELQLQTKHRASPKRQNGE